MANSQPLGKNKEVDKQSALVVALFFILLFMICILCLDGCNGATASSPPPPLPPVIGVTISPLSASVGLGATQQFIATVTNTANLSVNWTVNGIAGGNAALGSISSNGLYTAPQVLPQPAAVIVQAVSQVDSNANASATVAITSDVAISVAPLNANVELGATQVFVPHISSSGIVNASVVWTVSGAGCVNATCGTIDAAGNYTAPSTLPSPATILVTVRSVADPSRSATALIAITSHITLTVSGPSSMENSTTAIFSATLTPAPNSNPSLAISWNASGSSCTGAACGTFLSSGASAVYEAPVGMAFASVVTLTATPAADPSKAASINVTITAQVTVVVTPSTAELNLFDSQQFGAQVTGNANTNVIWNVNGVVGGNSAFGTLTNISGGSSVIYTAPGAVPTPSTVVIHAVSAADQRSIGQATITLSNNQSIRLTPVSGSAAVGDRMRLTAAISGVQSKNLTWQVGAIPGGNSIVGQICQVASNPCAVVSTATAGDVEYLAPAAVPMPNPVTLIVASQENPALVTSARLTVLAHIVVSVSPPSTNLDPAATQSFTATVLGTTDQDVTWQVIGAACSGAGAPCGTITSNGLYTSPTSTPSPNSIGIVATSSEDTSRAGSSAVTINNTVVIVNLLPGSAFAGSAGSFTMQVQGGNFRPTSPGPGSVILVGGTPRITSCASSGMCTTVLTSTDLAITGNLPVTIQNPDLTKSNTAGFVVVAISQGVDIIPLTPANPTITGKDIKVVEPSTAGSLAPQQNVTIAVAAMGIFSPASGSCTLGAGSIVILRPATGTATIDVCILSISGLDPSFIYSITGRATPDITIIGKQPLGLGIVDLTLAIPSTALPGMRSLFVQNPNNDKAVATGALEIH